MTVYCVYARIRRSTDTFRDRGPRQQRPRQGQALSWIIGWALKHLQITPAATYLLYYESCGTTRTGIEEAEWRDALSATTVGRLYYNFKLRLLCLLSLDRRTLRFRVQKLTYYFRSKPRARTAWATFFKLSPRRCGPFRDRKTDLVQHPSKNERSCNW